VPEAADPENNVPARFAPGSRVQKMLFKVPSTFDDEERGPVLGHVFRGISLGCASCQRDKLRTFIN
jgi:hypothetical protein